MVETASRVSGADIDRMTDRLYVEGRRKQSAFWVLLTLAAVIAGSGVVEDSDATVIGAMIVAPLMTPILGTALAVVLADRARIVRGVTTVLLGAALVVVLGYLLGLLVPEPVVAATNSQVASRVSPDLIDLVGALATGLVGAFALVRTDISDTLPGVAIAISLVPPLAVVGLTLESGEPGQALGALLLFASNVAAIVATGAALLTAYRLRAVAEDDGRPVGRLGRGTVAVVAGFVVLVAVPLGVGSYQVFTDSTTLAGVRPVAERWATAGSWQVVDVSDTADGVRVEVLGPPPGPDVALLRQELDRAGYGDVAVQVALVFGGTRELPAGT
ncbi:TIGR00341 family protein [Actinomycetospora sp. CA-101289]|uniref:TIGR00341 family protein n=1 Tax=Actinomycetospora sp. CA-101289 TaxID=3239893 RepID=UPI003D95BC08